MKDVLQNGQAEEITNSIKKVTIFDKNMIELLLETLQIKKLETRF